MAPEIILGMGHRGPGADLWSLGVILYEFVVGPLPFGDKFSEQIDIFREVLVGKLDVPANKVAEPECRDLIERLLERKVTQRIGCDPKSEHGVREVRKHDFFFDFDLELLPRRQVVPPLIPDEQEIEQMGSEPVMNTTGESIETGIICDWDAGF